MGASARITDRSGKIAPKGFCAGQISEKFEERKQSAAGFKERLFNEHHSKQLLMHFKVLQKAIPDDQKDEFSEAFADIITYIEQTKAKNEMQTKVVDEDQIDTAPSEEPIFDEEEYYKPYYSTLDTYGT